MSSLSRFFLPHFQALLCCWPFSGLLLALSFPKADLPFLAWIALIPLLIALEGQSPRTASSWASSPGWPHMAGLSTGLT